ncbi:hypothetical protein [Spirosoma sp. KNUC1025]|uniref:hypothetical protein n=1 Tax=Spirosoma sp. KNUC1025 TaxID=2894082 RepID=UPI001E40CEA6|nr:hypothetical protein [Spirosoma sp. KNUC1025]UFH57542.1 hypothetical protein LN737_31040 [Spirosoma sp. KNUC1025]
MKFYDWNLYALGLTVGSLVVTRLTYSLLPDSWQGLFVFGALILYALAYPVLGGAIWFAVQGNAIWWKSLLLVGVTFVQTNITLLAYLFLMAEQYNGSLNNR